MYRKDDFFEDDPFWSVENLMPKKKPLSKPNKETPAQKGASDPSKQPPVPPQPPSPPQSSVPTRRREATYKAAGEKAGTAQTDDSFAKGGIVPFSKEPESVRLYTEGAIHRAEVYAWPNAYGFFGTFKKNAAAICGLRIESADYVPFFSFMPQFCQLTASQLRFYIYWRSKFLDGEYISADQSYLLLFAFEILNLPDMIDPFEGANRLCKLWIAYRKTFPKLDKYLSEWLCDYCLANGVQPERRLFEKVLPYGRTCSTLPEFYMTNDQAARPDILLSAYSFRQSKYRNDRNRTLFDTHIPAAMERFFEVLRRSGDPRFTREAITEAHCTRTTYDGAVCVCGEKKRLDVYYVPCRSGGTAAVVTDAVKLCENYIRAHEGIRARFPTPSLTAPMRNAIESYFAEHLPSGAIPRKAEDERYDYKYEPASKGFSDEEARRIEEQSLSVARRLGSVFEEDPAEKGDLPSSRGTKTSAEITTPSPLFDRAAPTPDTRYRGDPNVKEALSALYTGGGPAFSAFAAGLGKLPATIIEEINAEALDRYGDLAAEERDGAFFPIEDYKEEIESWINS